MHPKKLLVFLFILFIATPALPWGKTGHRVVGLIAERHLTKKARKNINRVLATETLAEVSDFMDFIRSDNKYKELDPLHYATIPDGMTYEEAGTPEQGDIIVTINRLVEELKSGNYSIEDEAFTLKCLVHLIGDIHQPLHVGNGTDRGGNDVKLEYFWQESNLHRVWDSGIIDGQDMSYTEYVEWIDHATKEQIAEWQSTTTLAWAYESQTYREQAYDLPENKKLSYRYDYDNLELVNLRLLQAGIRLAAVLNELYG